MKYYDYAHDVIPTHRVISCGLVRFMQMDPSNDLRFDKLSSILSKFYFLSVHTLLLDIRQSDEKGLRSFHVDK